MIEIRPDDKGVLDEVVAGGASVHLERMTRSRWFLIVEDGERALAIWIGGKEQPNFEWREKAKIPWPASEKRDND